MCYQRKKMPKYIPGDLEKFLPMKKILMKKVIVKKGHF